MPTPNSHNRDDGRPRNAIYRVVFLLRGFLAPASTMSAKKIAETIDALDTETYPLLYDTSDKSFVIWNHLFDIWEVVIAMANQIPDADSPQDRIVLLLKKLATVPLAKIELEDPLLGTRHLRIDLPRLESSLIDRLDGRLPGEENKDKESFSARIHFNAFVAALCLRLIGTLPEPNLAVETVIAALNIQPPTRNQMDCFAMVAANWIMVDGLLVFSTLHDSAVAEDGERVCVAKAGIHPGQWQLWKLQLSQLEHYVKRDTARVVYHAVYSMDVIEQQKALVV